MIVIRFALLYVGDFILDLIFESYFLLIRCTDYWQGNDNVQM